MLKTVGDAIAVDWVICRSAYRIISTIWDNSSNMANSDTTLAVCKREVLIRLWAPNWTAMAFGEVEVDV